MNSSKKSSYTPEFSRETRKKLKQLQMKLEFEFEIKISLKDLISKVTDASIDELVADPTKLISNTSLKSNTKIEA